MCPNHLTCCCLMCCRTGYTPAMSRITSFLIVFRLVLFTAFLKHFTSKVTSFLSRSFVSDHVWHWYVSVGRKMALMSFALVLVEMLGCFSKGASWELTALAFWHLVSIFLSSFPFSVNMLPRYLNSLFCFNWVPLMLISSLSGLLLTVMTSVLLVLIFMLYVSQLSLS